MSTQILTELPNIQKAGMDFETVSNEMYDIIKNHPDWKDSWPRFYDSEAGTVFIQLMSWVADNLSTKQDVLFNEMFLSTAQKDENKIRQLKQIGYVPQMPVSAKVPVRIDFDVLQEINLNVTPVRSGSFSNRVSEICSFSGNNTNNEVTNYEILKIKDGKPSYLDSVKLSYGDTSYRQDIDGDDIYALEGKTVYESFTATTNDGAFIDLQETNIAANSIQVYIVRSTEKLMEVNSFVSKEALDTSMPIPYVVEYNEDKTYRIRFGNKGILNEKRLLPAGTEVGIFYRTSSGSLGNIKPGFINATVNVRDENNIIHTAVIYNDLVGVGGVDGESLEAARLNGPLSIKTMDRAVTPEDYDIILNKNTSIFKSKAYTATNQPDNFKSYYGRFINPQETFSFILLNKNYSGVPTSEYNNFPWFTTVKEPRLNERYVFDNGNYNTSIKTSETYYNLTIMENNSNYTNFKNATILNLGSEFNNALFKEDNSENDYLKLKITTKEQNESFFNDISFDLLDKSIKNQVISMDNPLVMFDTNATFKSKQKFDLTTPIDVQKSRYINLILDGKAEIKIDLWVDRKSVDGVYPKDKPYYLYWTNTEDTVTSQALSLYGSNETKAAAKYRNGIVEIINNSITAIASGERFDDLFDVYLAGASYQYLGLNLPEGPATPIPGLSSSNYDFSLKINGTTYVFKMSKENWDNDVATLMNASGSWNTLENFAAYLNYVFKNNNGQYGIKKFDADGNLVDVEDGELSWLTAKAVMTTIFETDLSSDNDVNNNFNNVSEAYDLVLTNAVSSNGGLITDEDKEEMLSHLVSISYADDVNPKYIHRFDNVIDIDDNTLVYGYSNFLSTVINYQGGNNIKNKIPAPIQAADYGKDVASVVVDEETGTGYFCLKSPIIGEGSSIQFKRTDNDFMFEMLGLFFTNSGLSYKAYGVKKCYLVKNDTLAAYTVNNGNKDDIEDEILQGNIIFENSSIYNNQDFTELFANYKIAANDQIVLGSVYDNFYYTGNAADDELLKSEVSGVSGMYMRSTTLDNGVKSYSLDLNKSKFEIKFTSKKQDTNSLYAVKEDMNIVASDRISLLSADITTCPGDCPLVFSLDGMTEDDGLSVYLGECSTGSEVVNTIKNVIKNLPSNETLKENIDSIIRNSYYGINQIQIQNIDMADGNITFYYPSDDSDDYTNSIKTLYKTILGTNHTNSNLYKLYPVDDMDPVNVQYIDGTDEYFYCPSQDNPLVFTYRKLVTTVNEDGDEITVSRKADYFVTVEEIPIGNQFKYVFYINKTDGSMFPDAYFYVHFINDKTYNFGNNDKIPETDEGVLQNYMKNHIISGTEITFLQPYFKPYDIAANIKYNANFSESEVITAVKAAVDKVCDLKYAEIAGNMSIAKIHKAIMNCDGVDNCTITYFGFDYPSRKGNSESLQADFYQILCLNEDDGIQHGKIFTFEKSNE